MASPSPASNEQVLKATGTDTLGLIAEYDIHRSPKEEIDDQVEVKIVMVAGALREAQPPQFDPTLAPHPPVPYPVSNPKWWQDQYRKVPDYRPVNRELDREQRRQPPLFTAVGAFMIAGCSLIAVCHTYSNKLWIYQNLTLYLY